jgi:hypothetical protein
MRDSQRRHKENIRAFPLILLALVCVIGAELLACYFFAPNLYEQLTAPVRTGIHQLAAAGRRTWDRFSQAVFSPDNAEDSGDLETQLAQAPLQKPPSTLAAESVTQMIFRDGSFYLTGGAHEINYFDQTDSKWAQTPYGTDPLGEYGCGPTAMAMTVSSLTNTLTDPAAMANWAVEQGYWAKGQGSYLSIVPGAARFYGLNCTPIPTADISPDDLRQRLSTGEIAVALMTKGHFTNYGHFILLRGITLDGKVLVADSASPERSLTVWDLDLILDELAPRRSGGASLWMISAPSAAASS